IALRTRAEIPAQSPIDVRIDLQREHQRDSDRYLQAAVETLQTCAAMLGDVNLRELALSDPAWNDRDAAGRDGAIDRVPSWTTAASMLPELAVARAVSRRCWRAAAASGLPSWFGKGLAEFTARRAVLPIFERSSNTPGYAFLDQRYFGGFVPRLTWIRLLPETDGALVTEYRANQRIDLQAAGASAAQALAGKT